jgi:hypothetical protein
MILDDAKKYLRISSSQTAFDTEIEDLISAAQSDLALSGVLSTKTLDSTDSLIRRAVFIYVKANFGWDNPDSDKLMVSYNMLKMHLTLSQEYTLYTVTFTVTDGINPLEDALVTLGEAVMITNSSGIAKFTGIKKQQNLKYTVILDGYKDIEDNVDIEADVSVTVTMVVI